MIKEGGDNSLTRERDEREVTIEFYYKQITSEQNTSPTTRKYLPHNLEQIKQQNRTKIERKIEIDGNIQSNDTKLYTGRRTYQI